MPIKPKVTTEPIKGAVGGSAKGQGAGVDEVDFKLKRVSNASDRPLLPSFDGVTFSGGGAKGVGHVGVTNALGVEGLKKIKAASGASAGGMMAILVAMGLPPEQIYKAVKEQNIKLTRDSLESELQKVLVNGLKFMYPNDGRSDEQWKKITFAEFAQLPESKELNLSVSWISKRAHVQKELVCSAKTSPGMPIFLAATASAALPMIIRRVVIEEKMFARYFCQEWRDMFAEVGVKKLKLLDGGLMNNTPFASNEVKENLVVVFAESEGIYDRELTGTEKVKSAMAGISKNMMGQVQPYKNRQAVLKAADESPRDAVLYIEPGVGTTDTTKASQKMEEIVEMIEKDFWLHFQKPS